MSTPPEERAVSFEEAVAYAKEIGESLGGRQRLALEYLVRLAARGRRPSSANFEAVGHTVAGVQHFSKATTDLRRIANDVASAAENLTLGLAEAMQASRALRAEELEITGRTDGRDVDPDDR